MWQGHVMRVIGIWQGEGGKGWGHVVGLGLCGGVRACDKGLGNMARGRVATCGMGWGHVAGCRVMWQWVGACQKG